MTAAGQALCLVKAWELGNLQKLASALVWNCEVYRFNSELGLPQQRPALDMFEEVAL